MKRIVQNYWNLMFQLRNLIYPDYCVYSYLPKSLGQDQTAHTCCLVLANSLRFYYKNPVGLFII